MLTLQEVKSAAAMLSLLDRGELVEYLMGTLEEADDVTQTEIRAEWLKVAEDRLNELQSGKVLGIPAAEVLRGMPGGGK